MYNNSNYPRCKELYTVFEQNYYGKKIMAVQKSLIDTAIKKVKINGFQRTCFALMNHVARK